MENTKIMDNETEEVCDEVLEGEVVETEADGGTNLGTKAIIAGATVLLAAGIAFGVKKLVVPRAKFVYHKAKDAIANFKAKREAKKLEANYEDVFAEKLKEKEIDSEGQDS